MKKFLSALLAAALICTLAVPALADGAEEDAAESHWYDAAVQNMMEQGIMTGGDNGFAPDGRATRATVVQALYNMAGRPKTADQMATFPDIQGKWYEDAARWARQYSVTAGAEVGRFNGDDSITRTELAVFLYRYAMYAGIFVTCDGNLLVYKDGALAPEWGAYALQWAVSYKVINGTPDGYLTPGATATRAELAQTLTNFINLLQPEDMAKGTVPGKDPTPLPMADHGTHAPQ